jgi:ankyrin repeat protein
MPEGELEWTSPLCYAVEWGPSLEIVGFLLDQGVDVNHRNEDKCTALFCACNSGHVRMAALLLERGADPTIVGRDMMKTPLMVSTEGALTGCLELLLRHGGTDIDMRDASGRTALWHAAGSCALEQCRLLLEAGADVSIADEQGRGVVQAASGALVYEQLGEMVSMQQERMETARLLEVGAGAWRVCVCVWGWWMPSRCCLGV